MPESAEQKMRPGFWCNRRENDNTVVGSLTSGRRVGLDEEAAGETARVFPTRRRRTVGIEKDLARDWWQGWMRTERDRMLTLCKKDCGVEKVKKKKRFPRLRLEIACRTRFSLVMLGRQLQ